MGKFAWRSAASCEEGEDVPLVGCEGVGVGAEMGGGGVVNGEEKGGLSFWGGGGGLEGVGRRGGLRAEEKKEPLARPRTEDTCVRVNVRVC
jgi:hypothetical protein